ncbi:MAG: hypothetical protein KF681_14105 [Bdellovibrionaceae bacterium]|nr:hypothetical protein [Pseudobdellovibrionaceae bacterium]
MAKSVKKAKPASKGVLKPAAKVLKKLVKAAMPAKKATPKPATKAAAAKKPVPAKAAAATPKKAAAPKKPAAAEKTAEKPAGKTKGKIDAKGKKGKPEDLDEDLMVTDDEEIGGEEIPDLSDFDEEEDEDDETEDSDADASDEPSSVSAASNDDQEAILTDAEGRPYCKVRDCDQIAAVDSYCRYHYLLLWKKIQVRRKILVDGKLERYVEELTSRYPDKFLEMIKRDLRTEKDFLSAIAELEIDESANENEFDDDSQVLDEVRGFGAESSSMSDDEEF